MLFRISHQFFSQGREVTLVALLHNLDAMRSLADNEAGFLRHTLTTSIDGYQIVVAATLDIERDDCRIVDYDRPDVQTVRSHRSKTDAATLRNFRPRCNDRIFRYSTRPKSKRHSESTSPTGGIRSYAVWQPSGKPKRTAGIIPNNEK